MGRVDNELWAAPPELLRIPIHASVIHRQDPHARAHAYGAPSSASSNGGGGSALCTMWRVDTGTPALATNSCSSIRGCAATVIRPTGVHMSDEKAQALITHRLDFVSGVPGLVTTALAGCCAVGARSLGLFSGNTAPLQVHGLVCAGNFISAALDLKPGT